MSQVKNILASIVNIERYLKNEREFHFANRREDEVKRIDSLFNETKSIRYRLDVLEKYEKYIEVQKEIARGKE